jgi:hypothetical protein
MDSTLGLNPYSETNSLGTLAAFIQTYVVSPSRRRGLGKRTARSIVNAWRAQNLPLVSSLYSRSTSGADPLAVNDREMVAIVGCVRVTQSRG